jgi:hypothetical protein
VFLVWRPRHIPYGCSLSSSRLIALRCLPLRLYPPTYPCLTTQHHANVNVYCNEAFELYISNIEVQAFCRYSSDNTDCSYFFECRLSGSPCRYSQYQQLRLFRLSFHFPCAVGFHEHCHLFRGGGACLWTITAEAALNTTHYRTHHITPSPLPASPLFDSVPLHSLYVHIRFSSSPFFGHRSGEVVLQSLVCFWIASRTFLLVSYPRIKHISYSLLAPRQEDPQAVP